MGNGKRIGWEGEEKELREGIKEREKRGGQWK